METEKMKVNTPYAKRKMKVMREGQEKRKAKSLEQGKRKRKITSRG